MSGKTKFLIKYYLEDNTIEKKCIFVEGELRILILKKSHMELENRNEKNKVVILLAHPEWNESEANKALLDAVYNPVDVDLYNLYGDKQYTVTD